MLYDIEWTEPSFTDPETGLPVGAINWRAKMTYVALDALARMCQVEFRRINKATYDVQPVSLSLRGAALKNALYAEPNQQVVGKQFLAQIWNALKADEAAMRQLCLSRELPDGVPFVVPAFTLVATDLA